MFVPRILIIDDEASMRAVIKMVLQHVGHWDVLEAEDGARGLAIAREEHPDAIVCDVNMPVCDGPTTLAGLQADEGTRGIPVIFLTASDPQPLQALLKNSLKGILSKPFNPPDLVRVIGELLDTGKLEGPANRGGWG